MAVGTAFKAFFAALFNNEVSKKIEDALAGTPEPKAIEGGAKPAEKPTAPKPARSDAITLLSTLQREARLLDLVQESLDQFSDAQIGAASRDVLRDCRKTLDRMFAIEPLSEADEGEPLEVEEKASPARLRATGASHGKGTVVHRGWKATVCEIPSWSGRRNDAWILAPTEVEIS
ncbi:MAG: DUF2760 domain-containing protein [Aureliella sp.]